MPTWTLIIMLVATTGHQPNSMLAIPGFTSQEACQAEADRLPAVGGARATRHCAKVS